MESQDEEEEAEINLEQSQQDWTAQVKLFNVLQLVSNETKIVCNKTRGTFEAIFMCQLETGDSERRWSSYVEHKSVIINISYKGVPICNIYEKDVGINFQTRDSKEYITIGTKRLNSLVEIGRMRHQNNITYYVTYKSNYSEQKSVCKEALIVQRML